MPNYSKLIKGAKKAPLKIKTAPRLSKSCFLMIPISEIFKVFKKQNKIEIKFESTALADKTAVFDFEQQIKKRKHKCFPF